MMDKFTRSDLRLLAEAEADISVSLYMPTYRSGREVKQNEIRFSNLLKRLREKFAALKLESGSARRVLEQVEKLDSSGDWWQHQSDGLCVFVTADSMKTYRVPLSLEEYLAIDRRFYLTPLVELIQSDGSFYLLAVSQNDVRLMQGTRYQISEVQVENLPSDLKSALAIDEYISTLQHHSAGFTDQTGSTLFHGQGGGDPDDRKKKEILQFFQRIDEPLSRFLGDQRTPLVFAGVDYLFPIFREACHYTGLVEKPVEGNPEHQAHEQLLAQAWDLVRPQYESDQSSALQRFNDLSETAKAKSTLPEVVRAARMGAVDKLLVASGQKQFGLIRGNGETVEIVDESQVEAVELINDATVHTLAHGGTVYSYAKAEIQTPDGVAATLRFELAEPTSSNS